MKSFIDGTRRISYYRDITTTDSKRHFTIYSDIDRSFDAFTRIQRFRRTGQAIPRGNFHVLRSFDRFLDKDVASVRSLLIDFRVIGEFRNDQYDFERLNYCTGVEQGQSITNNRRAFDFIGRIDFMRKFARVITLYHSGNIDSAAAGGRLIDSFERKIRGNRFNECFEAAGSDRRQTDEFFRYFARHIRFDYRRQTYTHGIDRFASAIDEDLHTIDDARYIRCRRIARYDMFFKRNFIIFLLTFIRTGIFRGGRFAFDGIGTIRMVFGRAGQIERFIFRMIGGQRRERFFIMLTFNEAARIKDCRRFYTLFRNRFSNQREDASAHITNCFPIFC